jgi:CheY-like chemotaxis protein
VAKILVADDNSNIQKMVGLALKDHGIEVVAVGNGEAAVRKIADIRPDLVLADVFMPVRNGYEVCKYVKENPSLAHIPVILLVGAFDPLDEQEAQRVGADGVLKKPFVPPDPLISMVKSALSRAGVSINGSGAAKSSQAEPWGGGATIVSPKRVEEAPKVSAAPVEAEPIPEEIPVRPAPFTIEPGKEPVAFGNLLETPAAAEPEEDMSYVTPATSELLDRDWNAPEKNEEEEEEEEAPTASWRRDGGNEAFDTVDAPTPAQDWPEPVQEQSFVTEPPQHREETSFVHGPAPVAVPEFKAEEPAQAPQAPVPVPVAQEASPVIASPRPVSTESAPANSWFTNMSSPWEAEARKSSEVAPAWSAPAAGLEAPAAAAASAPPEELPERHAPIQEEPSFVSEVLAFASEVPSYSAPEALAEQPPYSVPTSSYESETEAVLPNYEAPVEASEASVSVSAVESIREEASQFMEQVQQQRQKLREKAVQPIREESVAPETDDLVAKVLARMSPEMLQAVTREILKPIVEAVVREELQKKS